MEGRSIMPRNIPADDSATGSPTSRRALLSAFAAAPAAALAAPVISPWHHALTLLHDRYDDEPAALVRTKERRSLSRFRYDNAETFFESLDRGFYDRRDEMLYQSGIVAQLALTSHLLDVGFPTSGTPGMSGSILPKGWPTPTQPASRITAPIWRALRRFSRPIGSGVMRTSSTTRDLTMAGSPLARFVRFYELCSIACATSPGIHAQVAHVIVSGGRGHDRAAAGRDVRRVLS